MTYLGFMEWEKQESNSLVSTIIELNAVSSFNMDVTSNQGTLVPTGAILKENDVNLIVKEYVIKHDENSQFEVSITNVRFIQDEFQYQDDFHLMQFQFSRENIDSETTKLIITISMRMPEDKTQYDIVSGSKAFFEVQLNPL